jgi:hypothetical protein
LPSLRRGVYLRHLVNWGAQMPDAEGRLSPAEITFIHGWVAQHNGGTMPACPVSKDQVWFVVPFVGQAVVYPAGTKLFPDIAYPTVVLVCANCGYAMEFNAAIMGLFPQVPPRPGKSDV